MWNCEPSSQAAAHNIHFAKAPLTFRCADGYCVYTIQQNTSIVWGPGTAFPLAFPLKFWLCGAQERYLALFWGPGTAFPRVPPYFNHWRLTCVFNKLMMMMMMIRVIRNYIY